ncbi:MAG TPA: hypothetical protein VK503_10850 [Candidatus Bathyarchaeia archaeon]|nr:hypothetical protein [Candidatus Bathyarchaeia archaeon]
MTGDEDRSKSPATTNRTFRLDAEAARLLEKESKERDISINAIVNELIVRDLRRDRDFRGVRIFPTSIQVLRLLTEEPSDDKILEIANKLLNDSVHLELYRRMIGDFTLENVLAAMKRNYEFVETRHDHKRIIILALYAGRKWSLLNGAIWQGLFKLAGLEVEYSVDENSVKFEFESMPEK